MIRRNDFNSQWWGGEVGIIDDPRFFELPEGERRAQLSRFEWVEFHSRSLPMTHTLHAAGFVFGDAHVQFRLPLRAKPLPASAAELELASATQAPFQIPAGAITVAEGERFFLLPGVDKAKVARRYAQEAAKLIAAAPDTCLCARRGGAVQGWFLSRPVSAGIELTLAMLSATATVSGGLLYSAALARYASDGFKVGTAGYSFRNSAVANLYASLGARITSVRETWMWLRP